MTVAASTWSLGAGPVASAFAAAAIAAAADATMLYRTVTGLPGNYGRYSANGDPLISYAAAATDLPSMIAQGAALRGVVADQAAVLTAAGDPASFAAAAVALVEAVRAAAAAAGDALRLLDGLVLFAAPAPGGSGDALMLEIRGVAVETAWLLRRSAGHALARAARDYVPNSYQDAAARRDRVAGLLDALAQFAANRFDDLAFSALTALRSAVVADLGKRGASLAPVTVQNFGACLPASVAAWRLYQDATRDADLLARNDCPHPSFLPPVIEALAQ